MNTDKYKVGNSNSIFRTLGASNHTDKDRQNEDFYATDPIAAELLLKEEKFSHNIWECACGQKHLSGVFEKHGYNVRSSDLVDHKVITKYDLPQSMSCCTEIDDEPVEFLCPVLYIAQKWLREIRGVYVYVEPVIGKRWKLSFCDFNVPTEESDWMENEINKGNGYKVYDTYEEALEAGIQEALKLI